VKPNLYINNQRIKPVDINSSFSYLGRSFNFDMSCDSQQTTLSETFSNLLQTIHNLPLHPQNKILIYQRYVLPAIRWDLTVGDLTETWIKQALDTKLCSYLRLWLDIPMSGSLDFIKLTKKQYGLKICFVSDKFLQCQVAYRQCLEKSRNADVKFVKEATSYGRNIKADSYISTREALKDIRNMTKNNIEKGLTTQSLVIKSIWAYALPRSAYHWSRVLEKNATEHLHIRDPIPGKLSSKPKQHQSMGNGCHRSMLFLPEQANLRTCDRRMQSLPS
jgi:hypothetical protein